MRHIDERYRSATAPFVDFFNHTIVAALHFFGVWKDTVVHAELHLSNATMLFSQTNWKFWNHESLIF